MRKVSVLSAVSLCALGAALSLSDVSLASAPASTGYAVPHSELSCFNVSNAQEINTCSDLKQWEVSDFITPGAHTVQVTGLRPNGGTFLCFACAATKEGSLNGCTSSVSPQVVDAHTQITVGTVNVPTFGTMWVSCSMSHGASFDSANW